MTKGLSILRGSVVALALAATASCATVPQDEGTDPKLTEALKGKTVEKTLSCIPLDEAQGTKVYRGAIAYSPSRRVTYVNTSPGCRTNDYDPLFVVEPLSGRQLCRGDTVRMVDRLSHMPSGFCILGDFTKYQSRR